MGSTQKIVSGVVWSTIVNIVNAVYGFIAVPILLNHFGKAEYGLIGLAMSINVYMNLMDMGFNTTNVRFYSTWLAEKKHDRLKKGFQTSLSFYGIIGLLNALIMILIAIYASNIFNVTEEQNVVLQHLMCILAATAFCYWFSSCFDQLVKATENIAWLQKITLATKVLMIIVLAATVIFNLSIELYFALTMLSQMAIVPMSISKIKKLTPFLSFVPKWDAQMFKEMLPYCMNIFSFSLFQFSFYNLRPVFLGMQGTIESVADYRILNGIIGVVTMLGGAFTGILLPSSSKAAANHNKEAYYRMAYDGTKYISILCCFCCFGMMSVGPEVITMYVGEKYLYLIPWYNLWLICTLGTHNQAISSLILAGTDIRAISYSSIVASVAGLFVAWFTIPYYNLGGVCIAFAVYVVIQLGFYYFYYWPVRMDISSIRILLRSFLPYVIIGLLCYIFVDNVIISFHNIFYQFLIRGICFTLLFALLAYLTLTDADKSFIRNIKK